MITVKNVLVATDFSECSEVARNYARALARQFKARLHVLHVVEMSTTEGFEIGGYVTAIPGVQAQLEETAAARLEAEVSDVDRRQLRVKLELAMLQPPAQAIVEYATRERIDLIVLGTHGRQGLAHFVMGSVAEKVVRTAPCPVLTVRHPEREFVTMAPAAVGVAS
jgi:nucleotide-binding universal stress UspA family protein